MRIAGRCAEVAAYLCGAVAIGVIVRHIAILLEYVTIGPLPFPLRGSAEGTAVYYLFERMGLSGYVKGDAVLIAGFVLTCAGAVLATRLRHARRTGIAAFVVRLVIGVSVLAYSYRFAGAVSLACMIGLWFAFRAGRVAQWILWAATLALCLAPYDVSCRKLEGPARLETRVTCGSEAAAAEYAANRRVCVGSDAPIYNEPIGVWVW
jgi:hypothetical protein